MTPHHAEARELHGSYRIRANMGTLMGAGVLATLLLALIGWLAGRQAWASLGLAEGAFAGGGGPGQAAVQLLLRLGKAFPRRKCMRRQPTC